MLDFFKDVYEEINGLDQKKVKEEKELKKENKKDEKIFNKWTKVVIYVMGVLYLLVAGVSISLILKTGFDLVVIKYILLIILDITAIILISNKNKKTQQIGLICIALFILINFGSTIISINFKQ